MTEWNSGNKISILQVTDMLSILLNTAHKLFKLIFITTLWGWYYYLLSLCVNHAFSTKRKRDFPLASLLFILHISIQTCFLWEHFADPQTLATGSSSMIYISLTVCYLTLSCVNVCYPSRTWKRQCKEYLVWFCFHSILASSTTLEAFNKYLLIEGINEQMIILPSIFRESPLFHQGRVARAPRQTRFRVYLLLGNC